MPSAPNNTDSARERREAFRAVAADYGFLQVYFTTPRKFDLGGNRFHLVDDAPAVYPWANSLAVLVYPYAPFTAEERVPAYYIASNIAYHNAKKFAAALAEIGIRAEKTDIPVKMQLTAEGIGIKCRSSLIALPGYGTRIVLLSFAVRGIHPEPLDALPADYQKAGSALNCGSCGLCKSACPTAAISDNGLVTERCMRLHMENASHSDSIRAAQKTFIGCEICQYACPHNAALLPADPEKYPMPDGSVVDLHKIFDLKRLISGDAAQARSFVGRNFTGNGKLTAEAIAFAANEAALYAALRTDISAAADSPFEAVRDAVRYAVETAENRRQCRSDLKNEENL